MTKIIYETPPKSYTFSTPTTYNTGVRDNCNPISVTIKVKVGPTDVLFVLIEFDTHLQFCF